MKRIILSITIGTVVLFIWNAISWMALPFHSNTLNNLPDAAFDTELLQENLPKDGVYHYPGIPNDNSTESFKELEMKLKEGPRITLMVVKKGASNLFEPKTFGINLIFNILTVIVTYLILTFIDHKSFKRVFLATMLIGLTVALVSDLPQMNWYMFPLEYTLTNVFDHLISFSLLGILFGRYTFYNT